MHVDIPSKIELNVIAASQICFMILNFSVAYAEGKEGLVHNNMQICEAFAFQLLKLSRQNFSANPYMCGM